MKCRQCGGRMISRREDFDYSSLSGGLPVTLRNVKVRRCRDCGEDEVSIERPVQLHRALARAVALQRRRLTGTEIRFLRKWMGLSSAGFADTMGVTPETASRWESSARNMGHPAERLLRLLVVMALPVKGYGAEQLRELGDDASPTVLEAREDKTGWRIRQAA